MSLNEVFFLEWVVGCFYVVLVFIVFVFRGVFCGACRFSFVSGCVVVAVWFVCLIVVRVGGTVWLGRYLVFAFDCGVFLGVLVIVL